MMDPNLYLGCSPHAISYCDSLKLKQDQNKRHWNGPLGGPYKRLLGKIEQEKKKNKRI